MMDASLSRRRLVSPDRMRQLMQHSDIRGSVQVGSPLAAILVTGTLLWNHRGNWWALPVFPVHGVLINFLYVGQHELSHGMVFRT
jgi:fatty acid desaturase